MFDQDHARRYRLAALGLRDQYTEIPALPVVTPNGHNPGNEEGEHLQRTDENETDVSSVATK